MFESSKCKELKQFDFDKLVGLELEECEKNWSKYYVGLDQQFKNIDPQDYQYDCDNNTDKNSVNYRRQKNICLYYQQKGKVNKNAKLRSIYDSRCGENSQTWQDTIDQQDRLVRFINSANLRLLIDIFKGNYEVVLESDTFFSDNYLDSQQYLYSLISLQGSFFKAKWEFINYNPNKINSILNSSCQYLQSNKKVLLEILTVFLGCFSGFTSFTQMLPE